MSQRVLVIGGTGQIGQHIVRQLQPAGFTPAVLARDTERARQTLGEGVERYRGDITETLAEPKAESCCRAEAEASAAAVIASGEGKQSASQSP